MFSFNCNFVLCTINQIFPCHDIISYTFVCSKWLFSIKKNDNIQFCSILRSCQKVKKSMRRKLTFQEELNSYVVPVLHLATFKETSSLYCFKTGFMPTLHGKLISWISTICSIMLCLSLDSITCHVLISNRIVKCCVLFLT